MNDVMRLKPVLPHRGAAVSFYRLIAAAALSLAKPTSNV